MQTNHYGFLYLGEGISITIRERKKNYNKTPFSFSSVLSLLFHAPIPSISFLTFSALQLGFSLFLNQSPISTNKKDLMDFARVQKELLECSRDIGSSGITVSPKSDNLARLTGTIPGPLGTPYEGGTFQIDIVLPDGYPFEPPKMQFATKVWHPNISSQSGAICLDILKDQWSPALTLKTALLSVQALLSAPQPDDPQDAVVAQQYLKDYQTFVGTARYWTETFAKNSALGVEEKVQKLVEMGFSEALARSALDSVGGDENLALEKLCSG